MLPRRAGSAASPTPTPPRRAREGRAGRGQRGRKAEPLDRLADFQARHAETAPAALRRLKEAAAGGGNVFEALMEAVRRCSLGQISEAFFEVGGQYRRNV